MKIAAVVVLFGLTFIEVRAEDLSKIPQPQGRAAMTNKGFVEYPDEAKRGRMTGSGIAVLDIDLKTGKVTAVRMEKSTGHAILDNATVRGLSSARFRAGTTLAQVRIPIRFTLGGAGGFYETVDVKKENMDDVLARFLGKGTVLKGPIPAYPRSPAWTERSGKGVYEIHADKDGKVQQVKILKHSGDATFDREVVKTLGKWRLRPRGKNLILELPLRFTLSPSSYAVDVGR